MSNEKEIQNMPDQEYKTRKLNKQGGSTILTVPNPLIQEVAKELNITLGELISNFNVSFEVFRDPKGSILNGEIVISIIERGGGVTK